MARPLTKNDSWCYTASKTSARRKVKRAQSKRQRKLRKQQILKGEL